MSSSTRVFNRIRKGSKASEFIESLIREADHGEARRFSTIGSMRSAGMSLKRTCGCGLDETVDIDAEIERLGEDAPLTDLAVQCPACGAVKTSVLPC